MAQAAHMPHPRHSGIQCRMDVDSIECMSGSSLPGFTCAAAHLLSTHLLGLPATASDNSNVHCVAERLSQIACPVSDHQLFV